MDNWKENLDLSIEEVSCTYIDWDFLIAVFSELEYAGCANKKLIEFKEYLSKMQLNRKGV